MRVLSGAILLFVLLSSAPTAHAEPLDLRPPVPGAAGQVFDSAVTRYSPGHRGVDLVAAPGEEVRASAQGTVRFAGMVAGRPTISVDHGAGLRTTYTPAVARVSAGQLVTGGQVIGTVGVDQHCRSACLHWGLTDGTDYHDPLAHGPAIPAIPTIRLLPLGSTPRARPPAPVPGGHLPVAGRTTSRFGMRTHPITGVRKLHDGTDLAASCGTPVTAPWPGRVVGAAFHSAYGYRVIVEHGGLRTGYAHLRGLEVRVGQVVAAGTRLGAVGSTGLSTGCHLHWMAWRNGTLVDPLGLLP